MRTTVRLDDRLLTDAKQHAARTGRTLTSLMEDALRTLLAIENRPKTKHLPELPTFGDGGLRPGVDLDSSAELLDRMEGPGGAA